MLPLRIAGLLALSGLSLTSFVVPDPISTQSPQERDEIVLANFSFNPSDIKLVAGRPVTIHLVNQGSGGHNFIAKNFFAAASMDAATRQKIGKNGVVELAKGESIDVTLIPKAGRYKVKCGHFLHASFGMTGTITVS